MGIHDVLAHPNGTVSDNDQIELNGAPTGVMKSAASSMLGGSSFRSQQRRRNSGPGGRYPGLRRAVLSSGPLKLPVNNNGGVAKAFDGKITRWSPTAVWLQPIAVIHVLA